MPTHNHDWTYRFDGATSELGKSSAVCPPGDFPLLVGVDGRFDGVLRRYPGNVHICHDQSDNLKVEAIGYPSTAAHGHITVDRIRYFDINRSTVSTGERVRGFMLGDMTNGKLEIWYRLSETDSTDMLWRHSCISQDTNEPRTDYSNGIVRGYWDLTSRGNYLYWFSGRVTDHKTISWASLIASEAAGGNTTAGGTSLVLGASAGGAAGDTDKYVGQMIIVDPGGANEQRNLITAYNDVSKSAFVQFPWNASLTTPNYSVEGFKYEVLGHGSPTMYATGVQTPTTTGRFQLPGRYKYAHRYRDTSRGRYSPLSTATESANITAGTYVEVTRNASESVPSGYDKVQIFSTLNSGTASYPADGTLYKIFEGAVAEFGTSATNGIRTGYTADDADDTSLTDPSYPSQYAYSPVYDEASSLTLATRTFAASTYQDLTVIVCESSAGGLLEIRWSSQYKLEPENFPTANTVRTFVPVSQKHNCRCIRSGDYLYVFVGSKLYLLQRTSNTVSAKEIWQNHSLVHADAVAVSNGFIYAATIKGIMEINGMTGEGRLMGGLTRLWYDRWRTYTVPSGSGTITSQTANRNIRAGYDSRMGCIYFQCVALAETLCLWIDSGKKTLLFDHLFHGLQTAPSLMDQNTERCYFFSDFRHCVYPNADSATTAAENMSGRILDTSDGNPTVAAYGTETLSSITGVDNGTYAYLQFAANTLTWPGTSAAQNWRGAFIYFLTDGNTEFPLRGRIIHNTATRIYLAEDSGSRWPSTGDGTTNSGGIVAFAPVTMIVVGSPLWGGSQRSRKIMTAQNVILGRVAGANVLTSNRGFIHLGAARHTDLLTDEPRSAPPGITGYPVKFRKRVELYPAAASGQAETAIDEDIPQVNWARVNADGVVLFPILWLSNANMPCEIQEWTIRGSIEDSEIVST